MNSETFQVYRHSGRFGIQGPSLALIAAVVIGFPLGFVYAYLVKWIPFVYLNFLATAGYGIVFGCVTGVLMRFGKVRNTVVAVGCGILVGVIALYFEWSAHIHALWEDAPLLCRPDQILAAMGFLYEHGSWSLRGGPVTGIPLAVVWVAEALFIVILSTLVPYTMIANTPYCETSQCWLDEEKTIETLDAFIHPDHLAAFRANDLSPLTQAIRKTPGSATFARLTLKHSPRCDEFCTVQVSNVVETADKDGNMTQTVENLTGTLMLPKSMFELVAGFERFRNEPMATV